MISSITSGSTGRVRSSRLRTVRVVVSNLSTTARSSGAASEADCTSPLSASACWSPYEGKGWKPKLVTMSVVMSQTLAFVGMQIVVPISMNAPFSPV